MTPREVLLRSTALALWAGFGRARAAAPDPKTDAGRAQTQKIAAAATRFLDRLDAAQRSAVLFRLAPQPQATAAHFKGGLRGDVVFTCEQYSGAMWSNFPVSDVPRPGLRLGSLDPGQREATMDLLRALLSGPGFAKVQDIMGSDQALADSGMPYACGRDAYTLALFGTPSVDQLFMVQFGGHHLALNVTLLGPQAVLAPVLTGCLPAIYTEGGRRVRALAAENDRAFALLASLDDGQRRDAMIDHPVTDLVLGPGHDGETVPPQGVMGRALSATQRDMLFGLACEWAGLLNDVHAAPRLAEIRAGLDDTAFAWSGPSTHEPDRNGRSYFRITGPQLFIEFAPQEPGGDLTMHTHTIYRDPSNAYGRALTG